MSHIVLLSCTKAKLDTESPAVELYSKSPMFQKTLAYGKSLRPDKMYILSAKHHLVDLDQKLSPYDKTLKEMPKAERDEWGQEVEKQMNSKGINPSQDKFTFLTGAEYAKPLTDIIPEENIEKPMEGKRMGERLQWLNTQIKNIKEIIIKVKNILYEYLKK